MEQLETWAGQKGVRVFELLHESGNREIVELDVINECNHRVFYDKNGNCVMEGWGDKNRGDWDEIKTVEQYIENLLEEGFVEITNNLKE